MKLVGPRWVLIVRSLRTVPFDPSPSSWSNITGITQLRLKRAVFEPALSSSTNLLSQSSSEPGDITKIPRENEGADCGAHAEDERDVGENKEVLERDWFRALHKVRRCFEEDQKLRFYSRKDCRL